MRIVNRLIFVVAVALLGQATQASDHGFYASGGGGFVDHHRIAGAVDGTYKFGPWVFSGRLFGTSEVDPLGAIVGFPGLNVSDPDCPLETSTDVALLAGLSTKYVQGTSATIELGLARATIVRRVEYEYTGVQSDPWDDELRYGGETKGTWGLAFQSQLYWRRFGLIVIGDANHSRSFGALLLARRIGKCN